jgi:hypothetical protein
MLYLEEKEQAFALCLSEALASECERETELCGSLYRFYLYENICVFYETSLLACSTRSRAMYVVYANAHSRINSLYISFFFK